MNKVVRAIILILCIVLIAGCHKAGYVDDDMSVENSRSEDDMGYTLYETKKSIETRPVEKYIMIPQNSKSISFNRIDDDYKDNDFEIHVKAAEGNPAQVQFNINGVDTENIDIVWSELKYVAFYDINKDGKKDIIIKVIRVRSVETVILLANSNGYEEVKQNDEEFEADVRLLDGFKLQVDIEKNNFHSSVDLADDYKGTLILEGYISEEGKVIKSDDNQMYNFRIAEIEYYEVDNELVMIRKYSLMSGKYNAGLIAVCQYRYINGEFVRTDIKFSEENYQYY